MQVVVGIGADRLLKQPELGSDQREPSPCRLARRHMQGAASGVKPMAREHRSVIHVQEDIDVGAVNRLEQQPQQLRLCVGKDENRVAARLRHETCLISCSHSTQYFSPTPEPSGNTSRTGPPYSGVRGTPSPSIATSPSEATSLETGIVTL